MQPRRIRLAVLLVTGLLLLALCGGTALLLNRLHGAAEVTARHMVQRVTRVAESTVNRHFLAVDGMLAGLPAVLAQIAQDGRLDQASANRMLRELNFQNFTFRDLLLVRPDGSPWAAALAASRSRWLLMDAGALAAATERGAAALSGPARNALTGEWSLLFLRAIDLPGIGPLVAVAEVPVPLIGTLLSPIGELPGLSIAVERSDGRVLAALPLDDLHMGQPMPWAAGTLPGDGSAVAAAGRLNATPTLSAARPLLYQDIFVVASYEASAAFAAWELDRRRLLLVASCLGILLVALAYALKLALRQRERIEAERTRARMVLEGAIETMPDGFVMFDTEDRLVVCNRRYRDLYAISAPFIRPGVRFEDLVREGARRGQYPQAGEDIEGFVAEVTAWHRSNQPSMERLLPDGRWLMVTERSTPDGGTVGIRTDITVLKQAMVELAQARDAAAAATAAKSRFLARMSHELRTPLNGVLGLAQALALDPQLSGEQRARATTLEEAGRHLVAVANDVLDLAKVEAGRLELHLGPARLEALLDSAAAMVRPAADGKRLELRRSLGPGLPEILRMDQTRLRQLLLNLLSNAVKFTPPGGVVELVALAAATLPDGRCLIRIEVRDTGPGVPEAQRRAIFSDFIQLARDQGPGGTGPGGTGLGLAIAAGIAQQMEGSIGCGDNPYSPSGQGAVFWVELPLEQATLPQNEAPAAASAARRPLLVLVADDVPANLAVARALLGSAGHTAECVGDGAQALAMLERDAPGCRFDAMLMDVMMPVMDGIEATRRIRALPGEAGRLPILAVTASAFAEDIAACRNAGMDAHLPKPIEREALLTMLERLTGGAAATPSPADATPAAPPGPESLPLLARRGDTWMIPGLDAATAERLAPVFAQEIAEQTEILQLAGPDSMPEAIAAAHRLAGSAATLGASRLAAMAQRFQAEARGLPPAGMLALRDRVLAVAAETRAALPAAEPRPENQAEPRPQNHAEPRRETQAEPVQDTEAEPRQDTTLA